MGQVLAHISDLHVSRFGEHVTSLKTRRLLGRQPRKRDGWEPEAQLEGWRVERSKKTLRLVDLDGVVHSQGKSLEKLAELAQERRRTEHNRLAADIPRGKELDALLAEDPQNTNLLFCKAAERLAQEGPDWVAITGDLTDNGVGYDLILAALAPWVEKKRLLAVPGNHDLYDTPPLVVPGHARKAEAEKRALWSDFAGRLGLPPDGAWAHDLGDGTVVCGMDSCVPAHTPFSASGAVTEETLSFLDSVLKRVPQDACRVAMLHHHVVNLPFRPTGWAPWQLGIRLRNSKPVYEFLVEHRFTLVMNGHRHVGYRYHPNHAPLFVSAPSATLGCRSGAAPRPFFWRIEIAGNEVTSVRERLI